MMQGLTERSDERPRRLEAGSGDRRDQLHRGLRLRRLGLLQDGSGPEEEGAREEALRTEQVRVLQDRFYLGHDVPFPIGEPRLQRRV